MYCNYYQFDLSLSSLYTMLLYVLSYNYIFAISTTLLQLMASSITNEKWFHHHSSFHLTLIFMASLFYSHLRTSFLSILSMLEPAEHKLHKKMSEYFIYLCFLSFISHNSVLPPVFKKRIHDLEIKVGSAANFECEVEDAPNVTFKWFKSNSELAQSEKYRIINHHSTSCLELLNSTKADSGVYSCHASNKHGTDSCSANLNITGKLIDLYNFKRCLHSGINNYKWDF